MNMEEEILDYQTNKENYKTDQMLTDSSFEEENIEYIDEDNDKVTELPELQIKDGLLNTFPSALASK
jgi:hypothetical protein